jgi:hypothetical protein
MPVYTINNSSRPTKKVTVDGDRNQVYPLGIDFSKFGTFGAFEDGTIIHKTVAQQGLPVKPDFLPKGIKWGHGEMARGILDFEMCEGVFIASENFRRVVEGLEPNIHQFVSVNIFWKNGKPDIPYYWLFPCNRIDSIHDTLSTFEYKEKTKSWRHVPGGKLVYDLAKIGGTHMWLDRGNHSTDGINVSEACKKAMEAAKLKGILYFEREAV